MTRGRSEWRRRALAGALVTCFGAACSLTTSLDGLTGGGADFDASGDAPRATLDGSETDDRAVSSGDDGSFANGDAGSLDALGSPDTTLDDADSPDAHQASDASTGGADASDASHGTTDAGSTWCSTVSPTPVFCDDFDQGKLATPWDQVTGTHGTVSLSGGVYTSAPNAMLATTVAQSSTYDVAAYKSFASLAGVADVFTLTFDMLIVDYDTTSKSGADLAAISLYDSTGSVWSLQLDVSYDASAVFDVDLSEDTIPGDGGPNVFTGHSVSTALPLNGWTRISLQLTLNNPNGNLGSNSVAIFFNGTKVGSASVSIPILNGVPQILVGATYVNPQNATWSVRYDDVTFVVK